MKYITSARFTAHFKKVYNLYAMQFLYYRSIIVRDDKMKIENNWFYWSINKNTMIEYGLERLHKK